MKKWTTAVAVMALGASLAMAATHEGGFGQHGRGEHGGFSEKFAQALNLTDAQKQQIQDIRKASREQNAAFFETAHNTMREFFAAKQANDTAKIEALKPTVEAQRAQMKQIRDAEMAKISTILTADQNAKWEQIKAERAARHQQKQ